MIRPFFLAACLALLAACGVQGDLERPAPLFGEAREQWEAEQARIKAEAAARAAADAAARGEEEAPPVAAQPQGAPVPN